ncbi:heparan-alpha-glucosaminide N-acetyltransferase [Azospirillum canadense]|uniref:heparan-alpha-glucosaminide N-acetyltransferase n=1 Tax=Azospirillum canadense TaxID=403962 RepID=UPI002227B0B0|nr:heparan-alpha-glucosaminide N-acetyltransferase [Azospirillum canadense]MCW2243456.1 putative membrane protein [Azospirillum canadense]
MRQKRAMPLLPPTISKTGAHRLGAIDVARGVALLAMAVYHGSWDLTFLGLAQFDLLNDPLWLAARTLILGSFLLLVGVSLVLATDRGLDPRRFGRRLLLLVLAAAAVSAVSSAMFPDSPISFGVLHHIAVASVLGLAFLRLPWPVTLALGVSVIAVGKTVALPLFDTPVLRWVGLMTFEPESNDYVPLFPWFGAVLFGIALGRLWRPRPAGVPRTRVGRGFAWAGRHSLAIYLIHQPMLFGALSLVALGIGVEPLDVRNFMESCTASCGNSGIEPAQCTARCRCVTEGLGRSDLWTDFINDRLNARAQAQVDTIIQRCSAPN